MRKMFMIICVVIICTCLGSSVYATCGHDDPEYTVCSLVYKSIDCTAEYLCYGQTIYRITAQICSRSYCGEIKGYNVGSEHLCEDAGHSASCPIGNYSYCYY